MLSSHIQNALQKSCPYTELYEVLEYAVFPPGKFFRPKLIEALSSDLGIKTQNYFHLATAVELHHAYTLVHDDLPSMDNDLTRRGKPSTHAKFGEWKAILAGDALLISSFEELLKISHERKEKIQKLMFWATGSKGLVAGQFLDLMAVKENKFIHTLRIHELKTARLIQVATLGTYFLSQKSGATIDFFRIGREIGVTFQLLDDLSELTDKEVSSHEKNINPFLNSFKDAINELTNSYSRLVRILSNHNLSHTRKMLSSYYENNRNELITKFEEIENKIEKESDQLKKWLTNFEML